MPTAALSLPQAPQGIALVGGSSAFPGVMRHTRQRTFSTDFEKAGLTSSSSTINLTATAGTPPQPVVSRPPSRQHSNASIKSTLFRTISSKAPLLLLLCTATSLTIVSQIITYQGLADSSVQVLAWAKYAASLSWALLLSHAQQQDDKPVTPRASRLMTLVGLLDVFAYALQVWGFQLCGAALGTLIFAATAQTFTAGLSYLFLGQKLSVGQLFSVALVCLGLFVRALAPAPYAASVASSKTSGHWIEDLTLAGVSGSQLAGIVILLISSMAYTVLAIAYDLLVRMEKQAPSHGALMLRIAKIGFASNTLYQVVYTLPRWQTLVSQPLAASGTSAVQAVLLLCLFGMVYNVHSYIQGLVFRAEGALGVGLVSAVRGATVSVVAGRMFCSPARPSQCLTAWTGASAAVITAGGLVWVVSKQPAAALPATPKAKKLPRAISSQRLLQVLVSEKSIKQQE